MNEMIVCDSCKRDLKFREAHTHRAIRCTECGELYCPECDDSQTAEILSMKPFQCGCCLMRVKT